MASQIRLSQSLTRHESDCIDVDDYVGSVRANVVPLDIRYKFCRVKLGC